jgi:hypothetical protein
MPNKTPGERVGMVKLEAASAKKTMLGMVAGMGASGETLPEGLMRAAQTEDKEGQIQQELEPSGGCKGDAGGKVEASERTTEDPTADHLLSDYRESEYISKVAGSHSVIMRPKKKGKFGPKSASGETGERHVPAAVQALVDGMGKEREGQFDSLGPDSD